MSDFSFLKSGTSYTKSTLSKEELLNIGSIFMILVQNAMKFANMYITHSHRTIVTDIDAINALKLEIMIFLERTDILEKAKNIVNKYKDRNSDIFQDYVEELDKLGNVIDEDIDNTYSKSLCSCNLCTTINNIDEKWNNWTPSTDLEQILKNNVVKLQ